ncbi:PepSY domain-containing protein [Tepidimonas sp.]|uniref:PepSY domain-containing protein n=1 Tax=Tepidimonas sp. TaxID=2002775 RepID=UPI002FE30303
MRSNLATALLAALLGGLPWAAHADRDHDRARAALLAGQILPLPVILDRVRPEVPGDVLEVELEREDGRWVYELKLLQPGGRLRKVAVDAATGQVLGGAGGR